MLENRAHFESEENNEAPYTGVMARRFSQDFSLKGAPFTNFNKKHSKGFSENPENSEKNSEVQNTSLMKTEKPERGILLNQGDYKPEYGPLMYEWFASKEKSKETYDTYTWKNGAVSEKVRKVPNPPPHFSEFARSIGVTWQTLKNWSKKYPEFSEYYEACVDIIQEFIVDNGLTGEYSGQFGIFAAKNLTKMRDVVVNRNENWNMKDVLDAIERGVDPNDQHEI